MCSIILCFPGFECNEQKQRCKRKIMCHLTQNLKDNHDMWVEVLKKEAAQKEREQLQLQDIKEVCTALYDPNSYILLV